MRLLFGLLLVASALFADGISGAEYGARRSALRKALNGVMVMVSPDAPEDLRNGFVQNTNFLYLSGWRGRNATLVLSREDEALFSPECDLRYNTSHRDALLRAGFTKCEPISAIAGAFKRALEHSSLVYAMPDDQAALKIVALPSSSHPIASPEQQISRLRMMKSAAEIELIQRSTEATIAAQLAGWKRLKPGLYEYQIAATMTNTYFERGCERSAYLPNVGSGPNSVNPEYWQNRRRIEAGDLVLMDVDAECSDYATDVSRTVPANGHFTARQREIYEIVLGAQRKVIAAIRPGMTLYGNDSNSLDKIARGYIDSHGNDLHGQSLGRYFPHLVGHHVGLDIHDPIAGAAALKPGMVIAIEPGIYIPEENIGVRIEDTLLVTDSGSRNLSEALPRDAVAVENLIRKRYSRDRSERKFVDFHYRSPPK